MIGIVGYFTVPAVAGYIINPGGGNGLLNKVSTLASTAVVSAGGAFGGSFTGHNHSSSNNTSTNTAAPASQAPSGNDHQKQKLDPEPAKTQ
jgi:hypothetical protein